MTQEPVEHMAMSHVTNINYQRKGNSPTKPDYQKCQNTMDKEDDVLTYPLDSTTLKAGQFNGQLTDHLQCTLHFLPLTKLHNYHLEKVQCCVSSHMVESRDNQWQRMREPESLEKEMDSIVV